jgi:hypothetical protein
MRDSLRRRLDRPAMFGSVAAVALVLGHSIAYMLAVGQARVREALLAGTGHGYWFIAVRLALVCAVAAVGSLLARAMSDRPSERNVTTAGPASTAMSLAALQVAGYTVMEVAERLIVHAPLSTLFVHDVFLLGIAIQVGLAGLASLGMRWLARVAQRLAKRADPIRLHLPRVVAAVRAGTSPMRTARFTTPRSSRAPPRLLAVGAAR